MRKSEIRKQIASQRPDFQTLEKMSEAVLKNFQGLEIFRQAKAAGAYMPLPEEVNITPLFQCLEHSFFIPAFDEALGGYRMAKYTPELKKGKFGIPEPAKPLWAEPDELDLILVPGVAFDRFGGRIGRGGGFYDRLLPQYSAVRVGICFDFQCLEPYCIGTHSFSQGLDRLPIEPHDCRMDRLITESEILNFAMNS